MSFLKSLRDRFGGKPAATTAAPAPRAPKPPPDPEPDAVAVPEISVDALAAALAGPEPPVVLDVREEWEWRQVHLPAGEGRTVLHIPMNTLPDHLDELPRDRPIVVLCAHGSRSYGVTHYLVEQGRAARNLTGGITRWAAAGYPTARA